MRPTNTMRRSLVAGAFVSLIALNACAPSTSHSRGVPAPTVAVARPRSTDLASGLVGFVRTPNGHPMVGATIAVGSERHVVSDDAGFYALAMPRAERVEVTLYFAETSQRRSITFTPNCIERIDWLVEAAAAPLH